MSPQPMSRDYVIISPARDEAEFARRTLDSVTGQTVPPALWVIVGLYAVMSLTVWAVYQRRGSEFGSTVI